MGIDNEERIKRLSDETYQGLFGVKKATFDLMLFVLEAAYKELHKFGGKPPKLSVLDKLVITLDYYKDYRSYERIAFDYGVVKATVWNAIDWVESVLIKDKRFQLPSKKELREAELEVILVDCTESPVQRPKKNNKNGIPERKNDILSKH